MKYIYQLFIIFTITFAGELLKHFIPLPIPASIYGLLIMLLLLITGALKLSNVERTADFLLEIMPLMFIPGGVGLVTAWPELRPVLIPVTVIMLVSTVIVMAVTGKTAELVMKLSGRSKRDE